MASVAISNSNNRLDAAEATTNWTKIGNSLAQEPDFVFQGTFSISSKVGTSLGGHYCAPGSVNMTTGDNVVCMFKALWSNYSQLAAVPSALHRIGSGTGAYYQYRIADDGSQGDINYPVKGGWLISPINPNVTAWRDSVVGSPSLTTANYFATLGNFGATSKSENVVTDALDLGDGLWLVGGDGGSTQGVFADFLNADEGQPSTGRFGHVSSIEGIFYVFGKLVIGRTAGATVTATGFAASLRTLVFPGGRVAAGWNGIEADIGNASTEVSMNNVSIIGRGRTGRKLFFGTNLDVNGGTEVITTPGIFNHGFITGDAAVYSVEGGSAISDLTNGVEYFVRRLTNQTLTLHTTRAGAYANTGTRNLTAAAAPGVEHSLTRQPDTGPDLTVTGTAGIFDAIDCVFQNLRFITLTSAAELLRCVIQGSRRLTMAQGLITDCTIIEPLLTIGEAFVITPDLADISGCSFDMGNIIAHAIEITAAGTYSFVGNTFTGYGPVKASFNASSGVNGTTEVITTDAPHGFVIGQPVYYGDEGGTPVSGLTDGSRYYLNILSTTTFSVHRTATDAGTDANRINLTAGSSETHYFYAANSAILNSSGGLVTINVSGGGSTPSVRNTPGSTTVVANTVPVEVNQVVANTQLAVYTVPGAVELYNEEVPPTSRFWWERFEGPGYNETWSEGETVGGGSTLDEDQSTAAISGKVDRWQSQCLRVVTASTENAYVQNNFGAPRTIVYASIDTILDAESLGTSQAATFLTAFDNAANILFELAWFQNASDELRIRANIRYDNADHTFESDAILSLDARYTVEVEWDTVANNWSWRIIDYSRAADGALVGPVVQDSGTNLTSTREFDRIRIGATAAAAATTMYLDRLALDSAGFTYEQATLEDVSFDYDYGGNQAIRVELRKSQFAPKYQDRSVPGTITISGFSVTANQISDTVAAT